MTKQFIKQVTVTGADDTTDIKSLLGIAQAYPFVEFGLLISQKQQGTNRFPSMDWLMHLMEAVLPYRYGQPFNLKLSAHLCGRWLRQLCLGHTVVWDAGTPWLSVFQRIQLNFHGEFHPVVDKFYPALLQGGKKQYIFQMDDVNNQLLPRAIYHGVNAVPLFDLSHGSGTVPDNWPKPLLDLYCGYAGGLSPDNLVEQVGKISSIVKRRHIWIDAETHLRSEDGRTFDVDKVIKFLEIAKPWVVTKERINSGGK